VKAVGHMQGLELCEQFYWQVVRPLIERRAPQLLGRHAAGLIGYGSDVLGYDDDRSWDHEWGPRCLIWLQEADYARHAAELDRALAGELPLTFGGHSTRFVEYPALKVLVPAHQGQPGVHHVALTTVPRHLRIGLGLQSLPPGTLEWLCMPEQKLLEWTGGRVFDDPVGEITRARRELAYLPDHVWHFKLLYAWERLGHVDVVALNALRGDTLSARLNLAKLVEGIVRIVFLLNRRYCPGTPKWLSRAFDALPRLAGEIGPQLERCLALEDVRQGRALLDPVLAALVEEHNRLGVTRPVALAAPDPIRERGLAGFSLQDVEDALRESLPSELCALALHGGCDQWIVNDDLLLWPEQYRKCRHLYRRETPIRRDGIGDRMI
jgi:hypothetical protein